MRTQLLSLMLIAAVSVAGCGDEAGVERLVVPLPSGTVSQVTLSQADADVEVRIGEVPGLMVWVDGRGPEVVELTLRDGQLRVEERCDGCVVHYVLVVPAETAVTVEAQRGALTVTDLDGPLTAQVVSGDVALVGLSGSVDLKVSAGDVDATGMWSPAFAARVTEGAFSGVWTRPPSSMVVQAGGDVEALVATYFYSADFAAEGVLTLNDFVEVPSSPHHLALSAGGDLWIDFGPAQGTDPSRR